MNTVNINKLAYIGSIPGKRDSDSWYTPREYIERVRNVLGGIDLDPFSSEEANISVKAKKIFTREDSALNTLWNNIGKVTVFMNPPFSNGLMTKAVDAFLGAWKSGQISKAIVLTNNATETQWFQALLDEATSICLVHRRIAFINIDGKSMSGNTRGQVFFYFGANQFLFKTEFMPVGAILIAETIDANQ